MALKIYAHGNSITGRVRKLNEDSFSYNSSKGVHGSLFVVCDGMGGHKAGEIASKYASKKLSQYFFKSSQDNIAARLIESIKQINNDIYQASQKDKTKKGMGTTLVAAYLFKNKLYIANVGDSRSYLIRNKSIKKLTVDHSWVEEKVKEGVITRAQARVHHNKNVITRCIGYDLDVEVDTYICELKTGDRIILCTDGLWDEFNDLEIKKILSENRNIKDAINNLIKEANTRGGKDNITCIGLDYGKFKSYIQVDKKVLTIIALSALSLVLAIALIYFIRNPIISPYDRTEIKESEEVEDILGDGDLEEAGKTDASTEEDAEESLKEEDGEILEEEELTKYKDISTAEAKDLIENNSDIIILDVSSRYDEGHLPNALNYYLNDGSLDDAIPIFDKEATYLIYSHTDRASKLGAKKLIEAGFTNVYRLEGNYNSWVDAGFEVETGMFIEEVQEVLKIESPNFNSNEMMPIKYTCDGEDINPQLDISGVPKEAVSLVLIVVDSDSLVGNRTHWTIWNILPDTKTITENSVPSGAIEGITDFELTGYNGPCPSSGVHHYFFKLFALDINLDLGIITTAEEITSAMEGHILASAELIGLYE